jgi:heterodisulfide reductase subunit C
VDLAGIVDALREMSRGAGAAAPSTAVPVFNEIFLDEVRERGRVFELGLMIRFKLRTRRFFEDAGKAPMMLRKGKLALWAPKVGGKDERKALFGRAAEGGAK